MEADGVEVDGAAMPDEAQEYADMENEPLTVGQLIGLLEEVEDKSVPIYSEGCDCIELAFTIDEFGGTYGDDSPGILIERHHNRYVAPPPRPTLEELERGIDVLPEASIPDDAPSAAVVPSEGTEVHDPKFCVLCISGGHSDERVPHD